MNLAFLICLLSGVSAYYPHPPLCVKNLLHERTRRLSELVASTELCSMEEKGALKSVEDMFNFLEWAIYQNITQPETSLFRCNRHSWSSWYFPGSTGPPGYPEDHCQHIFELVQTCSSLNEHKNLATRRLLEAKCKGINQSRLLFKGGDFRQDSTPLPLRENTSDAMSLLRNAWSMLANGKP